MPRYCILTINIRSRLTICAQVAATPAGGVTTQGHFEFDIAVMIDFPYASNKGIRGRLTATMGRSARLAATTCGAAGIFNVSSSCLEVWRPKDGRLKSG